MFKSILNNQWTPQILTASPRMPIIGEVAWILRNFRRKEVNWLHPIMEISCCLSIALSIQRQGLSRQLYHPWLGTQLSPLARRGAKGSTSPKLCVSLWQSLFLWLGLTLILAVKRSPHFHLEHMT